MVDSDIGFNSLYRIVRDGHDGFGGCSGQWRCEGRHDNRPSEARISRLRRRVRCRVAGVQRAVHHSRASQSERLSSFLSCSHSLRRDDACGSQIELVANEPHDGRIPPCRADCSNRQRARPDNACAYDALGACN